MHDLPEITNYLGSTGTLCKNPQAVIDSIVIDGKRIDLPPSGALSLQDLTDMIMHGFWLCYYFAIKPADHEKWYRDHSVEITVHYMSREGIVETAILEREPGADVTWHITFPDDSKEVTT